MALEISEISIRLAVGDAAPAPAADASAIAADDDTPSAPDTDEIVRRCVREVIAALRLAGER